MKIINRLYNFVQNKRKVRSSATIDKSADILNSWVSGEIEIGQHVEVKDDVRLAGKISIGDYTSIWGPNTQIYSKINPITIGKFCSIARGVTLQEYNHNMRASTYMINSKLFGKSQTEDVFSNGSIIIGNDVWIGAQCVILSGATISDGTIVAANSVITKGVTPPYSIVAGSPAKVVKMRFSPDIIDMFIKLKWWDKEINWLMQNQAIFSSQLDDKRLLELLLPLVNE